MSINISIIVVNYAQPELTSTCLQSIFAAEAGGAVVHTVLVDNGSPDPYKISKKLARHDVSLLRSDANLGFTGGNNMGIHAAIERFNSDFVLLLNNDTEISPTAIRELLSFADTHQQYGIISPKIYFVAGEEFHSQNYGKSHRGSVLWYAGGSIDWRNLDTFHRGVDEVDRQQFDMQESSDYATGCTLLIRREVLEKIGLLDKDFFLYYEDADWSERARAFGYQIGFAPKAHVWHHNAGSSQGSGSIIHQYYQTRNRLLFFWRHGTSQTRLTVLRLLLQFILKGSKMEKKAALHFLLRKFGKQPIT